MCYFCFNNFCSVFIVSISFLLNIGKEMSLSGFCSITHCNCRYQKERTSLIVGNT